MRTSNQREDTRGRIQMAWAGIARRFKEAPALILGLVGFLSALVTLAIPVENWLFSTDRTVYVLHPEASEGEGLWTDFRAGIETVLEGQQAGLDSGFLELGKFKLRFLRRTWQNPEELVEQLEEIEEDEDALAIISATNSEESGLLLSRMTGDSSPVVLLATATRTNLLRRKDESDASKSKAKAGVFRMVPNDELQAERLAGTIVSSPQPPCQTASSKPIAVAILREEATNAEFATDLTDQLRTILEGGQGVHVVADAAVDGMLTVPEELIALELDFLVYVGSQRQGVTLVRQIEIMKHNTDACLPQLLLTDAAIIGDGSQSIRAMKEASMATLPLAQEAPETGHSPASFFTLGHDSASLVIEASKAAIQKPSAHLSRSELISGLYSRSFYGMAQTYTFEGGENATADFHLWQVSGGKWKHELNLCRSDQDLENFEHRPPSGMRYRRASSTLPRGLEKPWRGEELRIGAKPFTEQTLLSDLAIGALIDAGIPARRGPSSLNGIRSLLLLDRIHGYWEYTGSALKRYLEEANLRGHSAVTRLRKLDEHRAVWMDPLAFNNSFAVFGKVGFLEPNGITNLSDFAEYQRSRGEAVVCASPGWFELKDGIAGIEKHYEFNLPPAQRKEVPLSLLYDEFEASCQLGVGGATDARLSNSELLVLEDDRAFFPEYRPAFVLRRDVYDEIARDYPERLDHFERTLDCVRRHLDGTKVRELNARIELGAEDPAAVAGEFLETWCSSTTRAVLDMNA